MPKEGVVDKAEVTADIATHAALDTGVHGAGSDTLATDADITTHAALTTGAHGVGAGAIVGTGLTQTLTAKTLTSPTIQGTVAAGTGLTMPAFTSGEITLGANNILFTDIRLKQVTAALFGIRNLADNAYLGLILDTVSCQSVFSLATAGALTTGNDDNDYMLFKSRDSGVGLVEVARLVGAADPYLQMTLAMRLLPIATASLPATPVEGMLAYDDTVNKLKVYNGAAWETVTSA